MKENKKLSILIPCFNEEKGIGKVLENIPVKTLKSLGYSTHIVVIDNNSTDNTALVAKKHHVTILTESRQGKGHAIKKGFDALAKDTTYVVMLDGDNSYKPYEIPRLLEPLENNFCDVVVGSRLSGKIEKDAWTFFHRGANWFYTFFVRQFYKANTTDVLSGYFAWKKDVIDHIRPYLKTGGFAIEMEMIIKTVRMGYTVYSVPITYSQREGRSKLQPISDGIRISTIFLRYLTWSTQKGKRYARTKGERKTNV